MSHSLLTYAVFVCLLPSADSQSSKGDFLFPHNYFNVDKLSPKDMFIIYMMAISSLEYGGNTEEEYDKLGKIRQQDAKPGSLAALVEQVLKEKLDAAKNVTATPPKRPPPAKNATAAANEEAETAAAGDFRPKPRPSGDLKRPKEPFTARKTRKAAEGENSLESTTLRSFSIQQDDAEYDADSAAKKSTTTAAPESENPFEDIATRPPKSPPYRHRGFLNKEQILGVSRNRPVHLLPSVELPEEFRSPPPEPEDPPLKRRRPYVEVDWAMPQILRLPIPPPLLEE